MQTVMPADRAHLAAMSCLALEVPGGPPDGSACWATCDDRWVADGARGRREVVRQLADLRRRLAAAEDAVTDALAAMKQAEGAFDAASDRFGAAERALEAVREQRAAGPGQTPACAGR
jgi:hypothetical protein